MAPRRFLVLAALIALVTGAAAQAVANRIAARNGTTTPTTAALPRSAGLLAAGADVVWAQLGGDVYRSDDGGRRFRASLPRAARGAPCGCAGPAFFLGPSDAWVVRSSVAEEGALQRAVVWQTTDGGRTWRAGSAVPGLPSPLSVAVLSYSISFATPAVGYLLGSGTDLGTGSEADPSDRDVGRLVSLLWKTSDGGRTWRRVIARGLPAGQSNLGSPANCGTTSWLTVSFASARVGFVATACAPGRAPLQTTDGGKEWRPADLERPPGGWPEDPQFGLPTVTADGAVLESASGLDRATDEDGWLVVERLTSDGTFDYVGRVQTDSLMTTGLDAVNATGSRLALLAAGSLPAEGDELFESSDGGASWRLAGHEALEDRAGLGAGARAPALAGDAAVAVVVSPAGRPNAHRSAHGPVVEAVLLNADLAAAGVGDAGGALDWSSDGGRSWLQTLTVSAQPPAVPPYDDVAFASARLGYLGGPAGVAVTTDGGRHVNPVLRLGAGEQVLRLEVTGHSSVVAVTTRRLLVTADGGLRWQVRHEPPGVAADAGDVEPASVDFVSPQVGFAPDCGLRQSSPALERTIDGGRSWQALAVPAGSGCAGSPPSLCVASSRVLYDLVVPAAASGAGLTGPFDAILYASSDGGDSWRRVGRAPDVLLACSGSTLWAADYAGAAMGFEPYVLFRSGDGGRSFTAVAGTVAKTARFGDFGGPYPAMTLTDGELDALSAVGAESAVLTTDCWACQAGLDLSVSVTTDGGSTWSRPDDVLSAGLSDALQSVSFVSPRVGFVLGVWSQGPGEVLVATSDGGRSWRQLSVLGAGS